MTYQRSFFQRRCDAAWRANWPYCQLVSRAVKDRADELADGAHTNLYIIRDTATDAVKIGLGVRPEARLDTLQVGNPHDLELVDWAPGTQALERFVHALLAEHRVRGEWFKPHDEVLVVCELLMPAGDLRRDMEDQGEEPDADATVAMLCSSADIVDDWLRKNPLQLTLDSGA